MYGFMVLIWFLAKHLKRKECTLDCNNNRASQRVIWLSYTHTNYVSVDHKQQRLFHELYKSKFLNFCSLCFCTVGYSAIHQLVLVLLSQVQLLLQSVESQEYQHRFSITRSVLFSIILSFVTGEVSSSTVLVLLHK